MALVNRPRYIRGPERGEAVFPPEKRTRFQHEPGAVFLCGHVFAYRRP